MFICPIPTDGQPRGESPVRRIEAQPMYTSACLVDAMGKNGNIGFMQLIVSCPQDCEADSVSTFQFFFAGIADTLGSAHVLVYAGLCHQNAC